MQLSLDFLEWVGAVIFGLALLWPLVAGILHLGHIKSNLLGIDEDPATAPKGFTDIVTLGFFPPEREHTQQPLCQ